MEPTEKWLNDNKDLTAHINSVFSTDSRLSGVALPDALLHDPTLLADIAKEITLEAIRRDAPSGVPEDILGVTRRLAKGSETLSPFIRKTLRSLTGLRDQGEIEPKLVEALQNADEANRPRIEGMLTVIRASSAGDNLKIQAGDEKGELGFSPVTCAACCWLACAVLPKDCSIACVVGCVSCGSIG